MKEIKREKKRLEQNIRNLRVGIRKCMSKSFFDGDKVKNAQEYHRLQNQIKDARNRLSEICKIV